MWWKALAALGAVGCGMLWHDHARQERELAHLQARIAEVQRLAASAWRAPAADREPPPQSAAPSFASPVAETVRPDDSAVELQPRVADWAARAEEAFATEGVDAGWARDAERSIEQAVGDLLPAGSRLRVVSCRETLCRVETEHAELAAVEQFKTDAIVGPSPLWRGALYASQADTPEGGGVISLYLVREGYEEAVALAVQ